MSRSRAYRAVRVKNVVLERLLQGREGVPVSVGMDVSKEEVMVVLRWGCGEFERPWRVDNPFELGLLVELLMSLQEERAVRIALEATGTYGDALRQACGDAGLPVHRVSPKACHDYAEVFDGVPSQHDGKDAAIIAELAGLGKSSLWPFERNAWERELAYWVDRLDIKRRELTMWFGRLEGMLARHWPEATRTHALRSGVLLRALARHGGPQELASAEGAVEQLQRWGRGKFSEEKARAMVSLAESSLGVRMEEIDRRRLREYAQEALSARREISRSQRELKRLANGHGVLEATREAARREPSAA